MKRLIILTISLLVTSLTITLSPLNAQSPPVPSARPSLNRLALLLALTPPATAPAQVTAQSKDLVPQKTDKGVLFQCSAPNAAAVYLAGDFNNWASNSNGVITDAAAKMTGPDSKGLWQTTVKLAPGDHSFKFSVNGAAELWLTPDWAIDRDADGNAVIHVTADGSPLLRSPSTGASATAKTYAVPTLSDAVAAYDAYTAAKKRNTDQLKTLVDSGLVFWVVVVIVVLLIFVARDRQRRVTHETIRLMIEKGQPVPPELFLDRKPWGAIRGRPRNDLRRGVIDVAFGIGLTVFLVSRHSTWWAIGSIFILMGVGHLIVWKMEPNPKNNDETS